MPWDRSSANGNRMPANPAIANIMYGAILGISDLLCLLFRFKISLGRLHMPVIFLITRGKRALCSSFRKALLEPAGDLPSRYIGDDFELLGYAVASWSLLGLEEPSLELADLTDIGSTIHFCERLSLHYVIHTDTS